jgi:predicted aspartyl protease
VSSVHPRRARRDPRAIVKPRNADRSRRQARREKSRYQLANGSEEVSDQVLLREVQVGEHAVRNVTASISPVQGEPLLGQSFLSKFGAVTLDYKRLVLILAP